MLDTKFMTGKEKEKVLKQWTTFVKNKFQFKHFTGPLYQHLIMHNNFIAHYNRYGFYDEYFKEPEQTIRFMKQFDRREGAISVEYGTSHWLTNNKDYEDLNTAMCEVMELYREVYEVSLKEQIKEQDIQQATTLLTKHGLL